jgi:hypothetical protein
VEMSAFAPHLKVTRIYFFTLCTAVCETANPSKHGCKLLRLTCF